MTGSSPQALDSALAHPARLMPQMPFESVPYLSAPVGWKGRVCLYPLRSKNDLPVWPWSSGNQILRIGVIGLGLTRRLSHSRDKVPLEGYGTITRRCYIFHAIGRARCGDWPLRMSRSLTGRIGWCIGRIKRRFTEQGCLFQFIVGGSAGVQLVKCQKGMETGAGNRGVNLLSLQIGIPEIMGWRVGRP